MTTIQSIQQRRNHKRKAAALVVALVDEDERQVQRSCQGSRFLKEIISVQKKAFVLPFHVLLFLLMLKAELIVQHFFRFLQAFQQLFSDLFQLVLEYEYQRPPSLVQEQSSRSAANWEPAFIGQCPADEKFYEKCLANASAEAKSPARQPSHPA